MGEYRDYSAGELIGAHKDVNQEKGANSRNAEGRLLLMRCYACGDPDYGRENHMAAVYGGYCAWCRWEDEKTKALDILETT